MEKSYLRIMLFAGKTVSFHTLGCKLNFSETSTIARLMQEKGFEKGSVLMVSQHD